MRVNLKLVIFLMGLLWMSSLSLFASGNALVLSKYSIPLNTKGGKIGDFVNSVGSLKITDDALGLFEIRNNELYLKKNKEITVNSPMIFVVRVQDNNMERTFELVKDEFIKNKVIAHRGAWKHHGVDHNTLGSIGEAINLGCEAAEIDVWLTKDKQIVLCHDMDIDGRLIEKTSLEDIKRVVLKKGENAPTLREVLQLLKKQNKTRLVIELKSNKSNDNVIALADSVMSLVNDMDAQAWVDYISFDYRGLLKLRNLDATASLSLLEPSVALDLQKLDGMTGIDYHYSVFDKDRLFERCKVLGLTTNAWTVNDKDEMKKLLNNDIDYITTDEPEMLLEVIAEK